MVILNRRPLTVNNLNDPTSPAPLAPQLASDSQGNSHYANIESFVFQDVYVVGTNDEGFNTLPTPCGR